MKHKMKVAICPLNPDNKGMAQAAFELVEMLNGICIITQLNEGSIDERFKQADTAMLEVCLVVDHITLVEDTVQIRALGFENNPERRIKLSELRDALTIKEPKKDEFITLTMKCPDCVDACINEHAGTAEERAELRQKLARWIRYNEYVDIQFNLTTGSTKLLEVR